MKNLQVYYDIIEKVIDSLGISVESCRGQTPGNYLLKKGSANLIIDVWYIEEYQAAYCQVISPVLKLPNDDLTSLYRELLEINLKQIGISFAVSDDYVYLVSNREAFGMDADEFYNMLTRVGNVADDYDNYLQDKYGLSSQT